MNYLFIPYIQRLHRLSFVMDEQFHPSLYNGCNYLSMLGLKSTDIAKIGPLWQKKKICNAPNYRAPDASQKNRPKSL